MPISRYFKLYLNAGRSIPLVINANQYDSGETWYFTLYTDTGEVYTPSSGAIIGIKADGHVIDNAATVDSRGRVVVTETEQMTAAAGKAVFEISIDDNSHGSANFIVLVEPKPSEGGVLSDSDLSLLQEAIDSTSPAAIAQGVSDWMDEHLAPGEWVIDDTLTVQGAAADAKKTGDEIADLKSAIETMGGVPSNVKMALFTLLQNTGYKPQIDLTDELATIEAWASVVTSLTLSASSLNVSGTTPQTITAEVVPSTASVAWTSSNDSVATVVGGVVTGVSNGTCTITATAGDLTATCAVTVTGFATVTSISAVYTQSGTVYASDSLDSLKDDLVVTATYSDSTTEVVTDYTLSGTLEVGTSTIAVTYSGVGTTFTVTVSALPPYAFTNGTYNVDDVATLEITRGNHIKLTFISALSTSPYGASVDLNNAHVGLDNNNNTWFTIPANKSATLALSNVVNSSYKNFQMNFRKVGVSQSASFGISDGTHTEGVEVTKTLTSAESVSLLFIYFSRDVQIAAGDVFEFDVTFTVDGERYI